MTDDMYSRTRILIGDEGVEKLKRARVLICGCGAVGGYAVEGIVRSGVGHITLVDGDVFSVTNLNRQIACTTDTIGRGKAECCAERARLVNPDIDVDVMVCHISDETLPSIFDREYDVVMDCIDTLACKADLIRYAYDGNLKVFSSMGAAMHVDPQRLHASTLDKTSVCPVARSLRRSLKDIDQSKISVVFSDEEPPRIPRETDEHGKGVIGSLPTVPAVAGMTLASMTLSYLLARD